MNIQQMMKQRVLKVAPPQLANFLEDKTVAIEPDASRLLIEVSQPRAEIKAECNLIDEWLVLLEKLGLYSLAFVVIDKPKPMEISIKALKIFKELRKRAN